MQNPLPNIPHRNCRKCGQLIEDTEFCSYCGTSKHKPIGPNAWQRFWSVRKFDPLGCWGIVTIVGLIASVPAVTFSVFLNLAGRWVVVVMGATLGPLMITLAAIAAIEFYKWFTTKGWPEIIDLVFPIR